MDLWQFAVVNHAGGTGVGSSAGWWPLITALVGIAGTLAGVWMTNRQRRAEMAAVAERERADRLLALRRDVYLPATAAVAEMITRLARVIDPAVKDAEISDLVDTLSPVLAQVQIVGSASTVQAVSAFQREYGKAAIDMMRLRLPIIDARQDVELAEQWSTRYADEFNRVLEMMREDVRAGSVDRARRATLERELDAARRHQGEQADAGIAARERLMTAQLAAARALLPRVRELQMHSIPALAAVRNELGIDGAGEILERELQATFELMEEALEALLRDAEQLAAKE